MNKLIMCVIKSAVVACISVCAIKNVYGKEEIFCYYTNPVDGYNWFLDTQVYVRLPNQIDVPVYWARKANDKSNEVQTPYGEAMYNLSANGTISITPKDNPENGPSFSGKFKDFPNRSLTQTWRGLQYSTNAKINFFNKFGEGREYHVACNKASQLDNFRLPDKPIGLTVNFVNKKDKLRQSWLPPQRGECRAVNISDDVKVTWEYGHSIYRVYTAKVNITFDGKPQQFTNGFIDTFEEASPKDGTPNLKYIAPVPTDEEQKEINRNIEHGIVPQYIENLELNDTTPRFYGLITMLAGGKDNGSLEWKLEVQDKNMSDIIKDLAKVYTIALENVSNPMPYFVVLPITAKTGQKMKWKLTIGDGKPNTTETKTSGLANGVYELECNVFADFLGDHTNIEATQ
ncbi:MAG: hypothetical protein K0R14_99 [Burkholderiales bacterium]|jgi:hypothetical protein|nr:hypothetical protein [Burkholderiales bacterium]